MRKAVLGLTSLAAVALSFACSSDGNAIFEDVPRGNGAEAGSGAGGSASGGGGAGAGNGGTNGAAAGNGGTPGNGGSISDGGEDGAPGGAAGSGGSTGTGGEAQGGDAGSGGTGGPTWPEVIFVASHGADTDDCGLEPSHACASISSGIARGVISGRDTVRVQAGSYPEVVVLRAGIHVLGGFDHEWVAGAYSDAAHQVVIEGGLDETSKQYMAVLAHDLAEPAVLENVVLAPPNAEGQREGGLDGRSSYGIHALSAKLSLKNVEIDAADGASGADGPKGADAPSTLASEAMDGKPGGDGTPLMSGMTCNNVPSEGGPPGTNGCDGGPSGLAPNGGKGGSGGARDKICGGASQDDTAQPGGDGANASTVVSSFFGLHGDGGSGASFCGPTTAGNPGAVSNGKAGTKSPASASLMDGFLYARSGGAGTTGENGGGGGGGGGAGGCDKFLNESRGAGGGGGGAGGCAARGGGGGGGGGGSSVGILAISSSIELMNVKVALGAGADGGSGGVGGQGQSGGLGSAGGAKGGSAAPGAGGDGGHGGHGGGGAGGNGGFAVGVFLKGSTMMGAPSVSGGSAGKGGKGGESAPSAPSGERDGVAGEEGNPGSVVAIQNE